MNDRRKTKPKPSGESGVGYCRPPVSRQFQKGQSGNPKGRPKASLNLKSVYEKAVTAEVTANVNGRKTKMAKIEAAIHQTVNKAAAGDPRALRQVLEDLKSLGIGLGVPDAGTGHVPVSEFYASVIERALAIRTPRPESSEDQP